MSKQVMREYVAKYKDLIDGEIEKEIEKRLTEVKEISPHLVPVVQAIKELSAGGKRLRGLLTILGYQVADGEINKDVIKAAAAMEIFHLGLLIHDDFMDRDELRRGVKTLNARYSDKHFAESMAVLAGDYTYAWVTDILSTLKLEGKNVIEGMRVWAKYFRRVGYGQTLDVMAEQREASEKEILAVLALKSGEYSCVLPLQLGSVLAGGSDKLQEQLFEYGMEIGWVFQLRDDYLAEFGDSEKTGKPVGNDSREGKKTFATMYGKEKTLEAINEHLEKGKKLVMGNEVMEELLKWMATRDN